MRKYFILQNLSCRRCARDVAEALIRDQRIRSARIEPDLTCLSLETDCQDQAEEILRGILEKLDLGISAHALPEDGPVRILSGTGNCAPGSRRPAGAARDRDCIECRREAEPSSGLSGGTAAPDPRGQDRAAPALLRFLIPGLTCPNCTARILEELRQEFAPGDVIFSPMSCTLTMTLPQSPSAPAPEDCLRAVTAAVGRHEPDLEVSLCPEDPEDSSGEAEDSRKDGETATDLIREARLLKVAAVLFAAGTAAFFLTPEDGVLRTCAGILLLTVLLMTGAGVARTAFRRLLNSGLLFSEQLLMTVAAAGAVLLGEYPEAAAVMLLYRIGEHFQARAVGRTRREIRQLLDLRPENAFLENADGSVIQVPASQIREDDVIAVRPGERIPCDGVILEGTSSLDTSGLTGESLPREAGPGDQVSSGTTVADGRLRIRVLRRASSSAAARIIRAAEDASRHRAPAEAFITTFARYYTPAVAAASILLTALPVLLLDGEPAVWFERSLIFLVVSCPCALVISVPLTYFSGIGLASRKGIMIKGSSHLDAMNSVRTVCLDKTGTLTRGILKVTGICPLNGTSREELLSVALALESASGHPAAAAVAGLCAQQGAEPAEASDLREIPGMGVTGTVDGLKAAAGSRRLMLREGVPLPEEDAGVAEVLVARGGKLLGRFLIGDEIRPESARLLQDLTALGIRTVILTGDSAGAAAKIAASLGQGEWHAELMPEDKARILGEIRSSSPGKTAFVGDGLNDTPALAAADVGFAMGGIGTDAAVETADAVIISDSPAAVADALGIARMTRRTVLQNIIFALGIKILLLAAGAAGLIGMWTAVFGDVGVMLLAVGNSLLMLRRGTRSLRAA